MVCLLFVTDAQENVLTKIGELQDLHDALEALETGWYSAVRLQKHILTTVQHQRFRAGKGASRSPLLLTK